jgi:mannose-1-phosphate guanylyltransferase
VSGEREPLSRAHAFILAGGRGTRFWPLSRRARPKQFLDFTGEGPLLALTVARLLPLIPPERLWVITGADLVDRVREVAPQIPASQIVGEPVGRNTAPAVALAAALLEAGGDSRVPFAVLPSDHLISPAGDFREALERCLREVATSDRIYTFGIRPTRPETGYGYIEAAQPLQPGQVAEVAAFHEKPDLETAREYVATGRHLWNCGIFAWNSTSVLDQLALHEAPMVEAVRELAAAGRPGTKNFQDAFEGAYTRCREVSIDYALLEKSNEVSVMQAPFEWNDVGHWNAMSEVWKTDPDGNATQGPVLALDSKNNIVFGEGALTALIGVDSLIVVRTGDATLVCHRDRAQDLRLLLERLQQPDLDQYT